MIGKKRPRQPSANPVQSRPGPKPIVPTDRQRHEVQLAVAVGMSLETIADAMDMSRRTLCRTFACELAVGRAKKLLASVVRLDDLAEAGNVAACKFLHGLMMNHGDGPEAPEDDKWAAVASKIEADLDAEANSPKNDEFWKTN
jgi:AraC-like DNA-binding protein